MRNVDRWSPSKYAQTASGLAASRDQSHLAVSSRLMAALIADEWSRLIPAHVSGRVLDLGCGRVPLFGHYRSFATSVVCADWPMSLHENEYVDVLCDVGSGLPFRDAIADTVISSDVLEHLAEPGAAFTEFSRILSPGGVLLLNTPFMYRVHEAPHDYLRHTRYSLERLARSAGLQVVEVSEVGGLLDVLADNLAKGLSAVPLLGPLAARLVQRLTLEFGNRGVGRRIRHATGVSFPLGHVMIARKDATCQRP